MKHFVLIMLSSVTFANITFAQHKDIVHKPPIDSIAVTNWPNLDGAQISPNGKYLSYIINNQPVGSSTLVIQDTASHWKKEIIGGMSGFFERESKEFVAYMNENIYFFPLGGGATDSLKGVSGYQQSLFGKNQWLAYSLKDSPSLMILRDISTHSERRFEKITAYAFDSNGKSLMMQVNDSSKNEFRNELDWLNLATGKLHTMWAGKDSDFILTFGFDQKGTQAVFTINKSKSNSIWYFKEGMARGIEKVNSNTPGIAPMDLKISNDAHFSKDGENIFFSLFKEPETITKNPDITPVDIYSYHDSVLQFQQPQLQPFNNTLGFWAAINVLSTSVFMLENEKRKRFGFAFDKFVLITNRTGIDPLIKYWWPARQKDSIWQFLLHDGTRRPLNTPISWYSFFSPDNRCLVYMDDKFEHFYSYEIDSQITNKISGEIPSCWLRVENPDFSGFRDIVGIAGWSADNKTVLVYDQYDIWELDLQGKIAPLNITKGYGRKHHIKFRIMDDGTDKVFSRGEELILVAFNMGNKYNGFYKFRPGSPSEPELLSMSPCLYYRLPTQKPVELSFDDGMKPVKASSSNVWIVKRQTSSESPNYYITRDFKRFSEVTKLHPENEYNWPNAELINYAQLDGTMSQGVLYRPADFDPMKKYPVIFNYYEQLSHCIYEFHFPSFSNDNINIPWFVSHGYLVFTPDMHYQLATKSGRVVGDYAINSVCGAAKYLERLPFVNAKRMGIQGHSFGGGQTLYLVTHSKLFAAACEAAGTVSDEVSSTMGFTRVNGRPVGGRFLHAEIGHDQIGATLWQRPDLYIRASPIFKADKVTAPLLIIHNQNDNSVDWNQGIMMYMALRRLQKPCWMLQYDGSGHGMSGANSIDYTKRMEQFFDYYLKDKLPPIWMTEGIPAWEKGIEPGYRLDPSGRIPPP